FDGQARVAALEVAGAVVLHAVPEDQVLRARRSADGICLYEGEALDGSLERGGREERARDRVAEELGARDHAASCSSAQRELGVVQRNARGLDGARERQVRITRLLEHAAERVDHEALVAVLR